MQHSSTESPLRALLRPVKPSTKSLILLGLLTVGATFLELLMPLYAKHVVDQFAIDGIDSSVIYILLAVIIAMAVLECITAWYGGYLGHSITHRLRYRLMGRILHADQRQLDNEHSTELSARVINDSKEVKTVLSEDLINLIGGSLSIVTVISLLIWLDWRLSLIVLGCILVGVVLIAPIALQMQSIGQNLQHSEAQLLQHTTEYFRNSKTIKANNAQQATLQKLTSFLDDAMHQGLKESRNLAVIGPIANFVLMLSLVSLLASSAYFIAQGTLTMGTVTAFILYLFGLTFPLVSMGVFFSNLSKANGVAIRLNKLDNLPTETQHKNTSAITPLAWLQASNLGLNIGDKQLLKEINFEHTGNGISFLMGKSGSGKTTLLQQWLSFYPPTQGQLRINGHNLSDLCQRHVRQHIAWVDQEPPLFHASVRENLLLGQSVDITDAQIFEVLKQVNLEHWLQRINHNLDMLINEQQHQLSGGEKQRFALARAMLKPFELLLLDEPTSALDSKNEQLVMNIIRDIAKQKPVIMTTHKASLVTAKDNLYTLEKGKITSVRKGSESLAESAVS